LLLIAPGELVDSLLGGSLDQKARDGAPGKVLGPPSGYPAGRGYAAVVAKREIVRDGLRKDERLRLAVLGYQHDAVRQRIARPVKTNGAPVDLDCACRNRIGSGDRAHQFCTPGADDACDAEDFAAPNAETDVGKVALSARQPLDLEQWRGLGRRRIDRREH